MSEKYLDVISKHMTQAQAAGILARRMKDLDMTFDVVEIVALKMAIDALMGGDSRSTDAMQKVENEAENALIVRIVDFLNETCGTSYRANTKATQAHIRAKLREGYTEQDFKDVIAFKASQWKDDKRMAEFLRPNTLFCGKFESYLQNARKAKPKKIETTIPEKPEEVEPEMTDEEWMQMMLNEAD